MGIDHLVFGSGDRVTGWGRLLETGAGLWFDPPHVSNLMMDEPMSEHAVRLHDADPAVVATGFTPEGSIPGWATVTGVWLEDAIRVETQSPVPPPRPRWMPWTRPPCPPPADGWPTGVNGAETDNLEFDLGDLQATGAAVMVVQFRPGPDQVVLVVAAADQAAVERRLRPQLGPWLCVVPSRWTRDQLDAVHAVLEEHLGDWTVNSFGIGAGADGQASVEVDLFRVRPEMARWAAELPDGLLHVTAALTPVTW